MSKTAEKIAKHLTGKGWAEAIWYFLEGTTIASGYAVLVSEIDAAIEGKIISKSEVDALRKDASNLEDAIDGALYYEKEYFAAKKERDYWRERATDLREQADNLERRNAQQSTWLTEAWPLSNQVPSLKDKLWEAEQEIHDLKLQLERFQVANENLNSDLIDEMEENDRVTDEWEALAQSQENTIQGLEAELKREQNPDIATATKRWVDAVGWKSDYQLFQEDSSQSEQTEKPAETIEPPSCLKPADALSWTSTQVYGGSENNAFHFDGKPCRDVNCDWQKNSHSFYTYIKPKSATLETKVYGSTPGPGTSPVLTELCWVKGCKYFGLKHPPVSSQSEQEKPGAAPNVGTW